MNRTHTDASLVDDSHVREEPPLQRKFVEALDRLSESEQLQEQNFAEEIHQHEVRVMISLALIVCHMIVT